jgi:hypothetical protein
MSSTGRRAHTTSRAQADGLAELVGRELVTSAPNLTVVPRHSTTPGLFKRFSGGQRLSHTVVHRSVRATRTGGWAASQYAALNRP